MIIKKSFHLITIILTVFFWLGCFFSLSGRVYAESSEISFSQYEIKTEVGKEIDLEVTISEAERIGRYYIVLRFDADRLVFNQGADEVDGEYIYLKGTGFGNEIHYSLSFNVKGSGEAGVLLTEAYIETDSSINEIVTSEINDVVIDVKGDNSDISFLERINDEIVQGEEAEESDTIPICGLIQLENNKVINVIDMGEYEPEIDIWNYKIITDKYKDQNMVFISDQEMNVRVLVGINERGRYCFWAYDSEEELLYPLNESNESGERLFIISAAACKSLTADITTQMISDNLVVYGINDAGHGDIFKYSEEGKLVSWSHDSETASESDNSNHSLKFAIIITIAVLAVIFVPFLFIRVLVRTQNDKKKEQPIRVSFIHRWIDNYNKTLSDRKQYFFVIRELTAREIKRKYARSYLGILWSVLNPLMTMGVMSLIFSYMFKRSIDNFPLYYLTGNIFWTLFSVATNSAMTALVDNKSLLLKAKLPKQTFVLSRIYTSLVNFGYTCIAFALVLIVFRIKPTIYMLLFPFDVLLALVFATGIGYVLAILYVFFADIKYLYGVALTLLLYMSAIFYPVTSLPPMLQKVIGFNPVYMSIYIGRECLVYGRMPHYSAWIKLTIAAVCSLAFGICVFKKQENRVMQRI